MALKLSPEQLAALADVGAKQFGRFLGRKRFEKLEKELMKDPSMKAAAVERVGAASRKLSGDYGMSDAERRQLTGKIAEGSVEEGRKTQDLLLREMVKSGNVGRSGKNVEMLAPVYRGLMEAPASARGKAAQASQQKAAAQAAADERTTAEGALRARYLLGERMKFEEKGAQAASKFAKGFTDRKLGDPADLAAAAGKARAVQTEKA